MIAELVGGPADGELIVVRPDCRTITYYTRGTMRPIHEFDPNARPRIVLYVRDETSLDPSSVVVDFVYEG